MCTVTYLPLPDRGFILTSNRDEQVVREIALPPRKYSINDVSVFYPKDPRAGGSWIATSNSEYTLCLLNGAGKKHVPATKYRISRGQVLLDFFKYNDATEFKNNYSFEGVEPFTLIIIHSNALREVQELTWNGREIQLSDLNDNQPLIWSSVTLYEPEVIKARQQWFRQWLAVAHENTLESITNFHRFGGTGDTKTDLLMNRENKVRTVSITSILKTENETRLQYHDVINDKDYKIRII